LAFWFGLAKCAGQDGVKLLKLWPYKVIVVHIRYCSWLMESVFNGLLYLEFTVLFWWGLARFKCLCKVKVKLSLLTGLGGP
jgi:hypothetical protein